MTETTKYDRTNESVDVYDELGDFSGTLAELHAQVNNLGVKHGWQSIVVFNAGYNNIDVYLNPEKPTKR